MRAKKRRYTGELATPVVVPGPPTFKGAVTPERVAEYWERYAQHPQDIFRQLDAELGKRMSLLMKHYGIDERNDDAMSELAYLLACEHVPGFQLVAEPKTKRGRKRKWDGLQLQNLHDDVQSVKRQRGINDRRALTFLARKPNSSWNPPSSHKGSMLHGLKPSKADSKTPSDTFQSHCSKHLLTFEPRCSPKNSGNKRRRFSRNL
jgi:hypothetical protein